MGLHRGKMVLKTISAIVKYLGCNESLRLECISDYENSWGGCTPIKGNLEVGRIYVVEQVEAHSSYTKIWFKDHGGPYNSVHFKNA